jgi:hypothetical protein
MSILNPQYSELIEATDDNSMPQLFDHIDYVIKKILNVKLKPRAPSRRLLPATIPQREAAATLTRTKIESSFFQGGRSAERTFHAKPSSALDLIGARGTNNKTSHEKIRI